MKKEGVSQHSEDQPGMKYRMRRKISDYFDRKQRMHYDSSQEIKIREQLSAEVDSVENDHQQKVKSHPSLYIGEHETENLVHCSKSAKHTYDKGGLSCAKCKIASKSAKCKCNQRAA